MNINAITSQNFGARIVDNDYHFGQIQDDLFNERRFGVQEFQDFQNKLKALPMGDVEFDEYFKHGENLHVFGKVHKPCNKIVPFEVKPTQYEYILDDILSTLKNVFKETCNHVKCPNRFIH